VVWVDIQKPSKSEIDFLKKEHDFHPIILDELLHDSARSKVEQEEDYLYLTFHFPIFDPMLKTSRRAELDFLITKQKVYTVHREPLEPVENFSRLLDTNEHFKDRALNQTTGHLAYYLIQQIIHFSLRQLRHVEENVHYISGELFKNREHKLLEKISYTKRDILNFSIITNPQEVLLNSLADIGVMFWGKGMKVYLSDLIGDHLKTVQYLENYKEVVESLENTNGQILSAKSNSVMQKFTIMAFLTFPFFFFTSLLAVDFIREFLTTPPERFWYIFFSIGSLVVLLAILFRKRRWL